MTSDMMRFGFILDLNHFYRESTGDVSFLYQICIRTKFYRRVSSSLIKIYIYIYIYIYILLWSYLRTFYWRRIFTLLLGKLFCSRTNTCASERTLRDEYDFQLRTGSVVIIISCLVWFLFFGRSLLDHDFEVTTSRLRCSLSSREIVDAPYRSDCFFITWASFWLDSLPIEVRLTRTSRAVLTTSFW